MTPELPSPRRCRDCGSRPTYLVDDDRICDECGWSKNEENNHPLRELVADWRDKADTYYRAHEEGLRDCMDEVSVIEILADELEETLDECNIGTEENDER